MATVVDVGGQRLAVGAALGGESGAHLVTQRLHARFTQAIGHRQVASIGLQSKVMTDELAAPSNSTGMRTAISISS